MRDAAGVRGIPLAVFPMPEEADETFERLRDAERLPIRDRSGRWLPRVERGRIGGVDGVVAVTGDGPRNARRSLEALLAEVRPSSVVVAGVAGGLTPGLQPGDVVVADRVVAHGDARPRRGSSAGVALAEARGARRGVVVTCDRLVDSVEAKKRVADSLGVGIAVADLETAEYVDSADARSVPWVVLRAVSDTHEEGLPSFLNECRDEDGAIDRSRVARKILTHPGGLPILLDLRKRIGRASGRLGELVEALMVASAAWLEEIVSDDRTGVGSRVPR